MKSWILIFCGWLVVCVIGWLISMGLTQLSKWVVVNEHEVGFGISAALVFSAIGTVAVKRLLRN